jgi:catechol 2,3-dioxygenase-like lactoylglutathione lyase family enzyme
MNARFLLALTLLTAAPALPQLAPPNAAGATIAHIHLNVSDVEAQEHFFTELGGTIVHRDKLVMAQFPGIYIILRKQDSTGDSAGSSVNHFGLYVKDVAASVAKWKADGLTWDAAQNGTQGYIHGPDNIRVEIYENKSIPGSVQMHHIHMFVTDPLAAQKWYVDNFGATAGKRGRADTANVPGTELTLAKADMPQAPTKGRLIDHIGFEVTNLDAFVAKLQAAGIQTDGPIRGTPNAAGLRLTYVTDPWGTQIELTEGLPPHGDSASR